MKTGWTQGLTQAVQGIGKGTGLQLREQGPWARPALTNGMPSFLLGSVASSVTHWLLTDLGGTSNSSPNAGVYESSRKQLLQTHPIQKQKVDMKEPVLTWSPRC